MGRRGMGATAVERILTYLLAFALVLSGVPTQALAEAYEDLQGTAGEYAGVPDDAVLGIGEDASGDPFERVLTDESMAIGASGPKLAAAVGATRSGKWGECSWALDNDGALRIWPTNGVSGRLADFGGDWLHPNVPWDEFSYEVRSVEMEEGVALPEDCGFMFSFYNLESIDVSGLDTSLVKNMSYMFYFCRFVTNLDVSSWDTSSVTDMEEMFGSCSSLTSLDISSWDTSSVTNMKGMFSACYSLASLDISSWDTSSVTDMGGMFTGCSKLTSLDVSTWDTSSVTDMGKMFASCSSLASLDLSSWDTSSVTNMEQIFYLCTSLASLNY